LLTAFIGAPSATEIALSTVYQTSIANVSPRHSAPDCAKAVSRATPTMVKIVRAQPIITAPSTPTVNRTVSANELCPSKGQWMAS
jgi:hypothetical protein